ncbi:ribosome silencing factor [Candidatus Omnitrophota bacterium]
MEDNVKVIDRAREIREAALNKKADDIVIMDMRAVSNVTDYFVICSAPSTRRVQAISEGIEDDLREKGVRYWHIEGRREGLWVLIDYGDVIVHVFHTNTREFYNLERLWRDAPKEYFAASCTSPKSKPT